MTGKSEKYIVIWFMYFKLWLVQTTVKCLPMHVFAKNARVAWNGKELRLQAVN